MAFKRKPKTENLDLKKTPQPISVEHAYAVRSLELGRSFVEHAIKEKAQRDGVAIGAEASFTFRMDPWSSLIRDETDGKVLIQWKDPLPIRNGIAV